MRCHSRFAARKVIDKKYERTQVLQGFLDGFRVCIPGDAKNLVVILLLGLL